MAGAHVQEVGTEQVLFGLVADLHLGHGDKVLVLADIVGKAFVTEGVDFAGDDKTVCPDFYEHTLNITIFSNESKKKCFFVAFCGF